MATFTAAVPTTGEKVNLTFSGSVTGVLSSNFEVVSGGILMELAAATGSGTAWSLPLTPRSGWIPAGQTVKVTYFAGGSITNATVTATNSSVATQAQQRYVEQGLGIFVHLSSSTWGTGGAVSSGYIAAIDMPGYDMEQWFTSVIVPVGARYAVLTAKHDAGFSLWPTAAGNYNISQTAFGIAHSGADLVRDWVRLCRKYNLGVGLYLNWYDPWWTTSRPGADGTYGAGYTAYMTQQITELFSNYGKIDMFWIDSLGYTLGYSPFTWADMVALRDLLQPACLLVNNAHDPPGSELVHSDIGVFEGGGAGGRPIPASTNTTPAEYTEDSRAGHPYDPWIWTLANESDFKDVYLIATTVEQTRTARCSYLLNFPPNTSGLMPTSNGTFAAQLGAMIGRRGANPVVPSLLNVRYGIDRGDGQTGQWGGGINASAILGVA